MTPPPVPAKPRVLAVHCYYRESGGEDAVFEGETALLAEHGHAVETFVRSNADWDVDSAPQKASAAAQTIWARRTNRELRSAIAAFRPDVVHVHNVFQRLSPAVYRTCRAAGVPVVQTLHNYRYGCVAATLFRDGAPCEDCVGRAIPWPGVVHACYRDSRAESAVVATMTSLHRAVGSWRMVDRYLATTPFAKSRFLAMGIPEHQVSVKPHFVSPDPGRRTEPLGSYVLYAGRLTTDKGVSVLLDAATAAPRTPIMIAGSGPLQAEAERRAADLPNVTLLGRQTRAQMSSLLHDAAAMVVPSQLYETFGMVAVEAYAHGLPVLATDGGALGDVVDDGVTGWVFPRGDAAALAALLRRVVDEPDVMAALGVAARQRYESCYTPAVGYAALAAIYTDVIASRRGAATA